MCLCATLCVLIAANLLLLSSYRRASSDSIASGLQSGLLSARSAHERAATQLSILDGWLEGDGFTSKSQKKVATAYREALATNLEKLVGVVVVHAARCGDDVRNARCRKSASKWLRVRSAHART